MAGPRSRRRRRARLAVVGLAAVVASLIASGCSTPPIASGTFAQQQRRIVALVNATGAAIGAPAEFTPVQTADPLPCYKKVLGYTVGHLAANHAEVPVLITIAGTVQGPALLPRVERYWRSRGLVVDTRGLADPRFPKIRTHVGDDLLVATGLAGAHELNLYGVTPCVRS